MVLSQIHFQGRLRRYSVVITVIRLCSSYLHCFFVLTALSNTVFFVISNEYSSLHFGHVISPSEPSHSLAKVLPHWVQVIILLPIISTILPVIIDNSSPKTKPEDKFSAFRMRYRSTGCVRFVVYSITIRICFLKSENFVIFATIQLSISNCCSMLYLYFIG